LLSDSQEPPEQHATGAPPRTPTKEDEETDANPKDQLLKSMTKMAESMQSIMQELAASSGGQASMSSMATQMGALMSSMATQQESQLTKLTKQKMRMLEPELVQSINEYSMQFQKDFLKYTKSCKHQEQLVILGNGTFNI
jgi:hypothetical protein